MCGMILTMHITPIKDRMNSIRVNGIEYRFFNHLYAISRCGKVLRKLAPFAPSTRDDGYVQIGHAKLLHRVVVSLWLPNRPGAKLVHHKDGNKQNNDARNLEWVTPIEHMGERHHDTVGKYKRTKATIAKLRAFRTGFRDTPEAAARKRAILDAVCPKRPCIINGTEYRSVRQAAISLAIPVSTVRMRCLSKNFPSYRMAKTNR